MGPPGCYFGTIFDPKLRPIDQKRGSKNCFEKWYPPGLKRLPVNKPRGSWRPRLACAISRTKTAAWTATAAATATIAKNVARVQFLFEFVTRIRLFLDVVVRFQLATCSKELMI